ncbi:hypothetical protein PCC9214_05397 (plasmid) [Planktothrix tepida]|uniref:HNH nuclease domain-containing protein n=1 Tax=Planktothrix tepida PCC 9214 TaxID=671072 RepID=A0A1J1LNT1_9CYAN|nr:hypothetical protein [Planktothrix tepida]CAD5988506.1 hypothetical protein PCC9214_05397 [Planktothrix tepida]CUR33902.1 conserved hypothetical protein [Planktothrix tepida PCC 9214]
MLARNVISSILKHDAKITSYKIALLRAINDVVLNFPDLQLYQRDVAIPLKLLAQFWIAYYWPFVQSEQPIFQGQRSLFKGEIRNDMTFRPQLTALRQEWEQVLGGVSRPSDGFFLIGELRVPRKYTKYPQSLHQAYAETVASIEKALEMPIKYAGLGHWEVFAKPCKLKLLDHPVIAVPGTQLEDKCLIVEANLWQAFQEMSLWVEALCIHEWCLFSEKVQQESPQRAERGLIYTLLTDRPDNRRPLTWERNQVDLLLMEGKEFICPWTEKRIVPGIEYHLDHLVPVSVIPINELWNLLPADPKFNSHKKRDRLPSLMRLQTAQPYFELAYQHYSSSALLSTALQEDIRIRFPTSDAMVPKTLAKAVVNLIEIVASSRNLARF